MTDLNFIAAIAADLNASKDKTDKAQSAYHARLVAAADTLLANGIKDIAPLRNKGDARDAWLDAIASAYLTKREFAAWKADGALRSKELACDGNTQGLTPKGKLNNRVSKRSTDILRDLSGVMATEGETAEEKVATAKAKGANANTARALDTRIAEELSKLIKAIDKDAKAELPALTHHGKVRQLLVTAADAIAQLQKDARKAAKVAPLKTPRKRGGNTDTTA